MAGTWVRTGTITVTSGSKKVTGSGTSWLSNLLQKVGKGCMCVIDNVISEVDYVNSDTELYLVEAWEGATASGKKYKIQVTVTDTIPELSSRISQSLAYANAQYGNLESWSTGAAANVTLTGPAGNQVTLPNLAAMNSGPGSSPDFDLRSPAQFLRWKNCGTGHTIFDASKGLSPTNAAISNINAQVPWGATFPTLMGWNGEQTYGVRVDSARQSDKALIADGWALENTSMTGNSLTSLELDYYVNAETVLLRLCRLPLSGSGSREIVTLTGSYGAWTEGKVEFSISATNREGFKLSGITDTAGSPRFLAYQQADGTAWLYLQMTSFTCIRATLAWTAYVSVTPFLDRQPPEGALVWDTGSGASQSLSTLMHDKNFPQVPGTWEPSVVGVSNFAAKNGTYMRQGGLAHIRAYISFIGLSVPSNSGEIYGIPFVPIWLGEGGYIPCAVYKGGVLQSEINACMRGGSTMITFNHVGSRAAYQFESGADYMVSATYQIA
ncbi:MAG: hypothetical protein PHV54_00910 [Tolumonas sp.]|nr:hypothetical protein [Tolumonas sp.]